MVYAASVDLNDRNHMYCLEESRFITSEIVGIKLQMVHFVNFIQREVTVTHFKAGPLMRFFVPESNQDREIIFALWFTTCRRCSTSQTFQKSINFMKKALFYVPITLKKKTKHAKDFSWRLARLWCWNSRCEYSFPSSFAPRMKARICKIPMPYFPYRKAMYLSK